jgi:Tol biopolymer transport system component
MGRYFFYEIIVYSTVTPHESYTIPWTTSLDSYLYTPRWIDNQHLIYPSWNIDRGYNEYRPEETYVINPFTQETEAGWNGKINPFPEDSFFVAPDWTRAVYDTQWFDIGWNASADWGIYDLISGDELASLPFTLKRLSIAWSPDSSKFVALAGEREQNQQILLIDREGQNREVILNVPPDLVSDYTTEIFNWSADSRYLLFRVGTKAIPRRYELYIADVEDERIFKTCMDVSSGLASSPDGKLLAMMSNGYGQRAVMILDLNAWALHTVAYHEGSVIGWRGN